MFQILMDYVLEFFLLILAIIISIYYIYEKKSSKGKKFKGSVPIPGLTKTHARMGNLVDLKLHGSIHKFLEHLHSEYGKVVSFYWRDTFVVSICDYSSFKNVKHLFNRPKLIFENYISFIGEECIQFANGDECRDRRKCYDRSFMADALIRHITTMAETGEEEMKKIDRSPTLTVESSQLTGYNMATKSILRCCIAPDNSDDSFFKLINLYDIIFDGLTKRLIHGKTFKASDKEEIKFQEAQKEFNHFIKDIVISRMKMLDEDSIKTERILIDDIIHFHGDVNIDVIVKEVLVYMLAGFHTSGNLFSWCLYYLAKNQTCQEKLFEEISENQFEFTNTKDCYTDIHRLSFLQACINETLRLSELSQFSTRVSTDDIVMEPYIIPANTPIIMAHGVSFTDPDVFKDPHIFDPDRFIAASLPSLSFVPFGFAGKRKCPGETFSYLEVSIWIIEFVKKYRFTLLRPEEEVKKVYGMVTSMAGAVSVVFQHR